MGHDDNAPCLCTLKLFMQIKFQVKIVNFNLRIKHKTVYRLKVLDVQHGK